MSQRSGQVLQIVTNVLFFRNDPTPDRGSQLPRAATLIISSLGFIHDLRAGILEPDTVRGTPLDMDQYTRMFGTARIPTEVRLQDTFKFEHSYLSRLSYREAARC